MEAQQLQFQSILQNSPITAFTECLHSCINDICGRKSNTYENFKSVTDWTSDEYTVVTNGMKQLFIDAVVNQLSRNEVLDKVSELDANRQEIIMECLEVRQGDIQNALLEEKCAISGPILQDFDWKIKWVMGSSKLSSLREPLLFLDLHLRDGKNMTTQKSDIKQKTVSLEMNKNELNKVLAVLEKAQEAVSNWQA